MSLVAGVLSLIAAGCGGTVDGAAAGSGTGGKTTGNSGGSSSANLGTGGASQAPASSGGAAGIATGGSSATGTGGMKIGTGGTTALGTGGAKAGTGGTRAGTGGQTVTGGGGSASSSASDPVLPAISGTCPTFATGTATIGGLGGIALQVGTRSQGTGSLLFYWHGTGSSAAEVRLVPAPVQQEILGQGGIIVSFGGTLGTGGDCSGTGTFSKDDFGVADLIAACAVRDYGIDPHRIYTTGCSAGGLQAGCMGALRSSYIAATVPNSGGEVTRLPVQDPKHVPSVMTMHGGSSDMVVVSFSMTSATYDTQMKAAGSFVVNCNHGGGHCGAPAALYTAGWEFMKAHPFGVAPEPYTAALPASFPTYCAKF